MSFIIYEQVKEGREKETIYRERREREVLLREKRGRKGNLQMKNEKLYVKATTKER